MEENKLGDFLEHFEYEPNEDNCYDDDEWYYHEADWYYYDAFDIENEEDLENDFVSVV